MKLSQVSKKLQEEKHNSPETVIHDLQRKVEAVQGENDHLRMVVKGLRRVPLANRGSLTTSRPPSSASSSAPTKKNSLISTQSLSASAGRTTARIIRSSSSQELMCEVELRGLEQQIRKLRLENHFLLQEKEHAVVVLFSCLVLVLHDRVALNSMRTQKFRELSTSGAISPPQHTKSATSLHDRSLETEFLKSRLQELTKQMEQMQVRFLLLLTIGCK